MAKLFRKVDIRARVWAFRFKKSQGSKVRWAWVRGFPPTRVPFHGPAPTHFIKQHWFGVVDVMGAPVVREAFGSNVRVIRPVSAGRRGASLSVAARLTFLCFFLLVVASFLLGSRAAIVAYVLFNNPSGCAVVLVSGRLCCWAGGPPCPAFSRTGYQCPPFPAWDFAGLFLGIPGSALAPGRQITVAD